MLLLQTAERKIICRNQIYLTTVVSLTLLPANMTVSFSFITRGDLKFHIHSKIGHFRDSVPSQALASVLEGTQCNTTSTNNI